MEFPLDFNKNWDAAMPVKSVEISSKIKLKSFGCDESYALENTLPLNDEEVANCGSVDAIAGPYGGVEK